MLPDMLTNSPESQRADGVDFVDNKKQPPAQDDRSHVDHAIDGVDCNIESSFQVVGVGCRLDVLQFYLKLV